MEELEKLYSEIRENLTNKDFSLKKDLFRSGWFRYFFKQRSPMAVWGQNTGLLKASFFSVRITKEFKKKLHDFYNLNIVPIIPFCKAICQNGWKWKVISIKEYNLIVYLYDFCKKLKEFDRLSYMDLKKFAVVEKAFFNLAINASYPAIIYRTAEKVFASYGEKLNMSDVQKSTLLLSIENLFNYQMMPVSFYKFVQAYNMSLFKTFYDWQDIIIDTKAQLVNKVFYNCSYQVFKEIIIYARTIMRVLDNLESQKEEARWLSELVLQGELTATGQIAGLFSSMGFKYDEYREDFFLFVITLLGGLIKQLELFTTAKWTMVDFEEREIQDKVIFDSQAEACFKAIKEEYLKLKSRFSATVIVKLEIAEFFEAHSFDTLLPDDAHRQLYKSFRLIISLFFDLALILYNIYSSKDTPSKESEFLLYMIEKPDKWCGQSVAGVYQYYYELLILLAHFFKDGKLETKIAGISSLTAKIETQQSVLNSILDTTNFLQERLSTGIDKGAVEKE